MLLAIINHLRNQEGQGMVEYGLILGLVTVGVLLSLTQIGTSVAGYFSDIAAKLQ